MTIAIPARWNAANDRWESPDGRFYFDEAAAQRAVDFFPDLLRHHMGEFAGRPFTLLEYQEKLLVRPLFGWKRASDGLRRFRKVFAFLPKGSGKALALDTPIATPTGWSTMGELSVGDLIFDDGGRPTRILATSAVMRDRECFEVEFDDGSLIVADADHLWLTETRRSPYANQAERLAAAAAHGREHWRFGVRTTREIARTLRNSNGMYQSANHSVPLASPLDTPIAKLPVEPYVLGVWLGDGDSDCARLTIGDRDVELVGHLTAVGAVVTKSNQHIRYRLGQPVTEQCGRGHDPADRNRLGRCLACERATDYARRHNLPVPSSAPSSLQASLRAAGVLGRKHIPPVYLRASIEQRLSLLQGLMDTDGYIDAKGTCEFSVTNERLAADAYELLVSLGIKTVNRCSPATLYGREVSKRYRLTFVPSTDMPVFRLQRKLARQGLRHNRRRLSGERRIVDVRPVPSVPVKCITIDAPSKLFLAGRSMIPTHNSPIAAGIGVYLARCDGEMASEVYALANDRNQARTVHTNAKYMVEDSPYLADGAEITKDAIAWADTRSTYMVLSSDASSAHGKRPHGLIFDELHGYAGERDRELFEALRKSLVKRRQPVLLMVSHAGTDDESICREEYDYSHALLSGTIEDETMLPVIFEASPAEDWTDPAVHRRVNPGYGVTVKADAVEMECREALNDPRKRNDFLRYHLNRWVNQATAWIPVEWWDACEPDSVGEWKAWLQRMTPELAALPCAAGLDLAQKYDLACCSVVFRVRLESALSAEVVADSPTGQAQKRSIDLNYRIIIVPFFWIPEETMRQREKEDNVPYSRWVELGLVTPTEGAVIDYSRIYQDITTKIAGLFPRLKDGVIGYDPAFATDLATNLRDRAGFRVEEVLQNYTHLSEVSHIFEALVKGRRVSHGAHRVLRNHVESVAVKTDDAGRIRPVKPKRAGKHIDGVVASLMGLKMLATLPDEARYQVMFLGARH